MSSAEETPSPEHGCEAVEIAQCTQPGAPEQQPAHAPQPPAYVQHYSMAHYPPVPSAYAQPSPFAEPYVIAGQKWRTNFWITIAHLLSAIYLSISILVLVNKLRGTNYTTLHYAGIIGMCLAWFMLAVTSIALLRITTMADLQSFRRVILWTLLLASLSMVLVIQLNAMNYIFFLVFYGPVAGLYVATYIAVGSAGTAPKNALLPQYLA